MSMDREPRVSGPARAGAALLLAGLSAASAAGCHKEKSAGREPVPVRVAPAEPAGGAGGVRYSANIQPREQVPLAFHSGGYVREIRKVRETDGQPRNVQPGDTVSRGTVLARVRETDYVERVNQGKAALAEAEADYGKQRLDFERARKLFESKSLAPADFDGARAAFEASEARVSGAKAQLDAARIALADTALVAPRDGLILARNVEEGTLVSSGTVGFVLADASSVKAVFGVPDTIVREVKVGQPLTLSVEAIPGAHFSGRITAIAPSADPQSRVFDVEVTIGNPDGRLRSGMIASVETGRAGAAPGASTAAVPLTAILRSPVDPKGFAVFIVEGGAGRSVARIRNVKLGPIVGNRIAVTSGLSVGEPVIVAGATIVVDGEAVRVIP
jgi:RND family efflux transporter MFP subunit